MSKMRFQLNKQGVAELMRSDGMQGVLTEKANTIRERCGVGYGQDIYVGKNRANAMVKADTIKARKDNLKNNTLLKALNS